MTSEKIRILGIVPYEGMKYTIQNQARLHPDIELTVFVGDLHEGAAIVQKSHPEDYDVIISRGGTAELIRTITRLPVIEIELSIYDILRSIKMADNVAPNYTIVGFPSITKSARILCDLMQYPAQICTIHSADEVSSVLLSLQKQGCRMIICDTVTSTAARQMGMNAILINSGTESIHHALEQAVNLCRNHSALRAENTFLRQALSKSGCDTIIFNEKQELFFSTMELAGHDSVIQILQKELKHLFGTEPQRLYKNISGTLYSITGRQIPYGNVFYPVFYLSANKIPFTSGKYGIRYLNQKELDSTFFNCFYNFTGNAPDPLPSLESFCQVSLPVMIVGEEGTGQESVAEAIYAKSPQNSSPLISIDFSLINDKTWLFLTNHCNSPFHDNNNTICFKNMELLSEKRSHQLLSLILDTHFTHRNRLLFSCTSSPDGTILSSCQDYISKLSCLTLRLPPLRERAAEIPALANLLLSSLNVQYSREILGLQSEALRRMQEYEWPGNYLQLQRLLRDLVVITTDSYLSEELLDRAIKKELTCSPSSPFTAPDGSLINLRQPLEQINCDIIRAVLKENNGNQSATAKQLGIGRTTLWRFLKNSGASKG